MSSTDKAIHRWEIIAIAAAIIELLYVFVEVTRGSQLALPDAQPTAALQLHEGEHPSFATFAGGNATARSIFRAASGSFARSYPSIKRT